MTPVEEPMSMTPAESAALITNNSECERHVQYIATLERWLAANGFEVREDLHADRVLVCACGFHDFMMHKVRRLLADLARAGVGGERLVLLGCLPRTHETQVAAAFPGTVIPQGDEARLDLLFQARVPFSAVRPPGLLDPTGRFPDPGVFHVRIARGCLRGCTFCAINRVHGPLQSRPEAAILADVQQALSRGCRRLFLMGEDTLAYGLDRGTTILALLSALLEKDPGLEIRLGSLHVRWLLRYADGLLAHIRQGTIRELCLGLQHVSEPVLARMGRPVAMAEVKRVLGRLRADGPDLRITADILVGFPGETWDDVQALLDFFAEDRTIDAVAHFAYSDLDGTPAQALPDKVDPIQAGLRWERLREALGPRSLYNSPEDEADPRTLAGRRAFQETVNKPWRFCTGWGRDP